MSTHHSSFADMVSLDRSSISSGSSVSFRRNLGYDFVRIKIENNLDFFLFSLGFLTRWATFSCFTVYNVEQHSGLFQNAVIYIFVILPLVYMQFTIGQYTQLGPIHFKYINPIMHGLGYVFLIMCVVEAIQTVTYLLDNVLYFLLTFQKDLQWMVCRNYEETCLDYATLQNCDNCIDKDTQLSAQLYWRYYYMNDNYRVTSFTFASLSRIILLASCWAVIYVILINFGRQLVKVIRTNMIIVDALILILLLVALCNTGSTSKLHLMFSFSLEQLTSFDMWLRIIKRNIRYVSLGKGIFIMMGNIMVITSQASMLSIGVVIMAFVHTLIGSMIMQISIGMISSYVNLTPENITTVFKVQDIQRPLLIIIPQGFGIMAAPQLWTAGYFFTCVVMILNNELIYITVIERNLTEAYPNLMRYRKYMLTLINVTFFGISSLLISNTMISVINFLHDIEFHQELFTVCLMVICVSYIYGVQKFSDDIHFFYGAQPTIFYKVCWYVLPVILTITYIRLFILKRDRPMYVSEPVRYIEIIVFTLIILPLPIWMIKQIYVHMRDKNVVGLFKSSERWGPADPEERHLRKIFNPREETRSRRRYETCHHNCLLNNKVYKKIVFEEDKIRNELFGIEKST